MPADFVCEYCKKSFLRETSLAVHMCEPKRRWLERDEMGVQIGLQAYLRFFEVTQGSSRLKNFDDFAKSAYYRAFVRFGRHCISIRAINIARFVDWLLRTNRKIDHWCRDTIYSEYIIQHVQQEAATDALQRAIEESMIWSQETASPAHDFLRYGNTNRVCYAINTGRVSAWVIYNCGSGQDFLDRLNQEQVGMIWAMIDADAWQRRFRDFPADAEYVKDILEKAGW